MTGGLLFSYLPFILTLLYLPYNTYLLCHPYFQPINHFLTVYLILRDWEYVG